MKKVTMDIIYHRGSAIGRHFATLGTGSLCGLVFVTLINGQVASDGPLGTTDAFCSLIELGSHIQVADLGLAAVDSIQDNEGVNLEIGKVEVNIDAIEAYEKVDEGVLLLSGYVCKQGLGDCFARREGLCYGEIEDEGFGIDIANVNTSLVSEENRISLAGGCNADVIFGVGRVGKEGLDDEVIECSCDCFNLISR